ncbi:hypothetical protein GCM10011510_18660 [Streptococcus himalayensis]|uniref:Uncharacterized protein n=1 Tax=Streptococcus himalayensis TaxID=1888195 RepID=A0A917EGB0_9STRE|nr:hypothetical protein GCM10011510_18660 [Streptococcus himalayensis]
MSELAFVAESFISDFVEVFDLLALLSLVFVLCSTVDELEELCFSVFCPQAVNKIETEANVNIDTITLFFISFSSLSLTIL